MDEKLTPKPDINREGGRGASADAVGNAAPIPQKDYQFFGAPDGSNESVGKPEVKAPSKPSLGSY